MGNSLIACISLFVACSTVSQTAWAQDGEPDDHGHYPIHLAVGAGKIEEVKRLIAQGADVNLRQVRTRNPKEGWPPLVNALHRPEIMKLLIEAGADVNASVPRDTLISWAAMRGKAEAVDLLLSHDAIINDGNRCPALLVALRKGHVGIAKNLVEHGAKFRQPSLQGEAKWAQSKTPWELATYPHDAFSAAVATGDLLLVESMLERGADPHYLITCCVAASKGRLEIMQLLVESIHAEKGISGNVLNAALASAAAFHQQEVTEFLLKAGAHRSWFEKGRKEAIRRAVFTGDRELAEQLYQGYKGQLDLGCLAGLGLMKELQGWLAHQRHEVHTLNPEYPGKHMTPLHAAAMNGRNEAVTYLLGIGAGPSTPAEGGFTPLHLAVRHGHLETAKLLIDGGANINATTVELMGGSVSVFLEAMRKHDFAMIANLDELGVEQITRNSHHLELGTANRLITFSRWVRAGEAMDKELAEKVKQDVDAQPPLWTKDLDFPDQPKRKLQAFKLGDGSHRKGSVVLILTNAENQALSLVAFATPPFSMDYSDAHVEPELRETNEGTLVTLRFVKTSIKDWSLQLRMANGKLERTQDPPLKLSKTE